MRRAHGNAHRRACMKLALDHHYSTAIAAKLRDEAFDVVAAVNQGWETEETRRCSSSAIRVRRSLVTNTWPTCTVIARGGLEVAGHSGLIFTSMQHGESRQKIGRYVESGRNCFKGSP